ncbi:MAG: ligase-associated DNA damage response endonuclease PdeM [Parvibaculum sp.]
MSDRAHEQTIAKNAAELSLCGERLHALSDGALYWPKHELLVVADIHFEKGSSYAARGRFLPPYDTSATLTRLEQLMAQLKPAKAIALGDSFHDGGAEARIAEADAMRIRKLVSACNWTWIAGNHDPLPPGFGGFVAEEVRMGALTFRHEPQVAPATGEVSGHLHPCALVRVRGRRLRRRCFATDTTRMILPAFGAYTGGLNVRDKAFDPLFAGQQFHAWMMGEAQVVPVSAARLLPD